LAFSRDRLQDGREVLGESHVEHLVGFVENHEAHGIELERSTPDVIECPARRRDHDIDTSTEDAQLLLHRLSAVYRKNAGPKLTTVAMNRLGDLHCELAGGYEDQRPHGRMLFADDPDALEERQRKGRGFPGAGRRLSENVAPR
jgi:hypothetical protein